MPKETFFNLSEEKQEKVMRSAIREFSVNGFEKGNIGDIAKNAGVAKGSMYQYFENKKELFLYSVQWTTELLYKKYNINNAIKEKDINFFDLIFQSSKEMWSQLRDEREVIIFIQEVFLGKCSSLTEESMDYMMKVSNENTLKLIQEGKRKGQIRKDIDDNILLHFITGASIKIKEYLINRARSIGEEMIDEDFEVNEKEIIAMIELLKNGMGAK